MLTGGRLYVSYIKLLLQKRKVALMGFNFFKVNFNYLYQKIRYYSDKCSSCKIVPTSLDVWCRVLCE